MFRGVIWHLFWEIAIEFKLGYLFDDIYEMEWECIKETGKYTHYILLKQRKDLQYLAFYVISKDSIMQIIACPMVHYWLILSFPLVGKGVANLLISLPRLTLLICEPYLLREGIKFVHSINVNSFTYKLTYLHTRFPDRDFLMYVLITCFHESWFFLFIISFSSRKKKYYFHKKNNSYIGIL